MVHVCVYLTDIVEVTALFRVYTKSALKRLKLQERRLLHTDAALSVKRSERLSSVHYVHIYRSVSCNPHLHFCQFLVLIQETIQVPPTFQIFYSSVGE